MEVVSDFYDVLIARTSLLYCGADMISLCVCGGEVCTELKPVVKWYCCICV